jgi:hypothetical protein
MEECISVFDMLKIGGVGPLVHIPLVLGVQENDS